MIKLSDDDLFLAAITAGCEPFWSDGVFGGAWHCGCKDKAHTCDSQCSDITVTSIREGQRWRENRLDPARKSHLTGR